MSVNVEVHRDRLADMLLEVSDATRLTVSHREVDVLRILPRHLHQEVSIPPSVARPLAHARMLIQLPQQNSRLFHVFIFYG